MDRAITVNLDDEASVRAMVVKLVDASRMGRLVEVTPELRGSPVLPALWRPMDVGSAIDWENLKEPETRLPEVIKAFENAISPLKGVWLALSDYFAEPALAIENCERCAVFKGKIGYRPIMFEHTNSGLYDMITSNILELLQTFEPIGVYRERQVQEATSEAEYNCVGISRKWYTSLNADLYGRNERNKLVCDGKDTFYVCFEIKRSWTKLDKEKNDVIVSVSNGRENTWSSGACAKFVPDGINATVISKAIYDALETWRADRVFALREGLDKLIDASCYYLQRNGYSDDTHFLQCSTKTVDYKKGTFKYIYNDKSKESQHWDSELSTKEHGLLFKVRDDALVEVFSIRKNPKGHDFNVSICLFECRIYRFWGEIPKLLSEFLYEQQLGDEQQLGEPRKILNDSGSPESCAALVKSAFFEDEGEESERNPKNRRYAVLTGKDSLTMDEEEAKVDSLKMEMVDKSAKLMTVYYNLCYMFLLSRKDVRSEFEVIGGNDEIEEKVVMWELSRLLYFARRGTRTASPVDNYKYEYIEKDEVKTAPSYSPDGMKTLRNGEILKELIKP